MPSADELLDRIAALEARVAELEKPLTGRDVYEVVKNDQRLHGAWDIKVTGT